MDSKKIGKYIFQKSTRKGKKLMVVVKNGSNIHFGDKYSEHYRDKTGFYSDLNHNDKQRRTSFRKRMEGIKLKDGSRAIDNKMQPAFYSYHYLW